MCPRGNLQRMPKILYLLLNAFIFEGFSYIRPLESTFLPRYDCVIAGSFIFELLYIPPIRLNHILVTASPFSHSSVVASFCTSSWKLSPTSPRLLRSSPPRSCFLRIKRPTVSTHRFYVASLLFLGEREWLEKNGSTRCLIGARGAEG